MGTHKGIDPSLAQQSSSFFIGSENQKPLSHGGLRCLVFSQGSVTRQGRSLSCHIRSHFSVNTVREATILPRILWASCHIWAILGFLPSFGRELVLLAMPCRSRLQKFRISV